MYGEHVPAIFLPYPNVVICSPCDSRTCIRIEPLHMAAIRTRQRRVLSRPFLDHEIGPCDRSGMPVSYLYFANVLCSGGIHLKEAIFLDHEAACRCSRGRDNCCITLHVDPSITCNLDARCRHFRGWLNEPIANLGCLRTYLAADHDSDPVRDSVPCPYLGYEIGRNDRIGMSVCSFAPFNFVYSSLSPTLGTAVGAHDHKTCYWSPLNGDNSREPAATLGVFARI